MLDPALGQVTVSVPDYFAACTPLIDRTIEATEAAMRKALGACDGDVPGLAAIYLVGGSSDLPVLARTLRDRFGRRLESPARRIREPEPGNDVWLFDGRLIRWNHFTGHGASTGGEISEDPATAKLCADAFETVWRRAVPHDTYEIN